MEPAAPTTHPTKQRLLTVGMAMLLKHGYNDLGVQSLLSITGTPKGSFYHHFRDKEDFALQVIGQYMAGVHDGLDLCLADDSLAPLDRVRRFFEMTQKSYQEEGYLGCLLGGLGQELAGVSEVFRHKIDECLSEISQRVAVCLTLAGERGELRPGTDSNRMAGLLVNCWEGAALRSRLRGDPEPLTEMLDFYFESAAVRN